MAAASTCYKHPRKEAVAHCRRCGQPICHDCILKTGSGVFCGIECAERAEERHAQIENAAPVLRRRFDPRRSLQGVLWLAVLCGAFYATMFLVHGMTNPADMARWLLKACATLFQLATR